MREYVIARSGHAYDARTYERIYLEREREVCACTAVSVRRYAYACARVYLSFMIEWTAPRALVYEYAYYTCMHVYMPRK